MLNRLFMEMIHYYKGDAKRIQHFVKVHSFAKLIGEMERVEGRDLAYTGSGSLRTRYRN